MDIVSILVIIAIVFIEILVFVLGILTRNMIDKTIYQESQLEKKSFFDQNKNRTQNTVQKVSIDDTKVVLGISTDDLKKSHGEIAQSIETTQDISKSINKLKQMKG